MRALLSFALLLGGATLSNTAFAHPLIDQSIQRFENAEFEAALALLERAEAGDDLTREDLVELYYQRALNLQGLGDEAGMDVALFRLAALDPERGTRRDAPPAMRRRFEAARARISAPLALQIDVAREGQRAHVTASVRNDEIGLTRSVRVRARVEETAWVEGTARVELTASADATIEAEATVIGPGGAPLLAERRLVTPSSAANDVTSERRVPIIPTTAEERDDGDSGALWWVVGGVAVVTGAVVAAVLLTSSSGASSEAGPPMVSFP